MLNMNNLLALTAPLPPMLITQNPELKNHKEIVGTSQEATILQWYMRKERHTTQNIMEKRERSIKY